MRFIRLEASEDGAPVFVNADAVLAVTALPSANGRDLTVCVVLLPGAQESHVRGSVAEVVAALESAAKLRGGG